MEQLVKKFDACDVKTQAVLKFIMCDHELWGEFAEKLEVRAIQISGNKGDAKKIILHPAGEKNARWTGVYHVYATVQHEGKRLVIDPYVSGENSYARIEEREFLNSNWRGAEGGKFILETIVPAPYDEQSCDAEGLPEYSLSDFINNFFDPDNVPKHSFYSI